MDKHAIQYPNVSFSKPIGKEKYLIKKNNSIGGCHVNWYEKAYVEIESNYYYQKFIPGVVSSAVFLADGTSAEVVGFNRQLQTNEFDDMPFLYRGAIALNSEEVKENQRVDMISNNITKAVGLKGLCGIDYILDNNNQVLVLEINPRPPGTFELHEKQKSLFAAHLESFQGKLPNYKKENKNETNLKGYAILYAKESVVISDKVKWPSWVKDRPMLHSVIKTKYPVCTVHAEENSIDKVEAILFNRLQKIESIIKTMQSTA